MRRRVRDAACVFRIHLARLRAEAGPFLLAALVFPVAMFWFASRVSGVRAGDPKSLGFLAGAVVFSISLTAISWLGYLLLENRFTGRLKLFATLPLAPSSYVFGILIFAVAQAAAGTATLLVVARAVGVRARLDAAGASLLGATVTLTMLCLCGVSVVIAARARSFAEGTLYTDALGAGLVILAPVFYPADALPRAVGAAAAWLPTSCAARAAETTLAGGHAVAPQLLALALMSAAALALGFRLMRWRED
ncbi:MAG: ABC transporter permease [Acidobacteria bacterium]|nr:ABC transporter permease [Acidobacteriota bacterium]